MRHSWLRYLGFLGFVGFLSSFTHNVGFAGFYGFFGFFGFKKHATDERFEANVNKATRNSFIVSLLVFVLSTVLATITSFNIYIYAFAINYGLLILTFTVSLIYYEQAGCDL